MSGGMTAGEMNRPSDLFVTAATLQRREVAPNLMAEAAAFCEMTQAIADDPGLAMRYVLNLARRLCNAGSAGLSLLRYDSEQQAVVRWEAVFGALAGYEGTDTPKASSPCGLCLDTGTTMVVLRPERAFEWLKGARPAIGEYLVVPLHDRRRESLGTLWIAHHDTTSRFCSDDARIAQQLAAQLVLALRLLGHASERRHALAVFESLGRAQQSLLAHDLHHERRLRGRLEEEHRQALRFKDAAITDVNHRTKNTLQAATSLLALHARSTTSAQVRTALLDSQNRLQILARTHELLCSNSGNAQDVLMPELLQTLGDALRQAFAATAATAPLEITCESITLPIAQAIPLALIANEAVTNAYKHAFTHNAFGQVTVHLKRTPENRFVLRIADTGKGLSAPEGGEGGIGFSLIRGFAAQLRGTLEIAKQAERDGTVLTLTFEPGSQSSDLHLTDSP